MISRVRKLGRTMFILVAIIAPIAFLVAIPRAEAAGIVPCGQDTTGPEGVPCTMCHFVVGFKNLIDWGLQIMTFFAVAVIVAMGILYIVSAGNASMTKMAKDGLKAVLYGFALMLMAYLIVLVLLVTLTNNLSNSDFTSSSFKIDSRGITFNCSTKSLSGTSTMPVGGGGGGGGGSLSCKTGKCAQKADVSAATKNNASGLDANLFMSIIDGGEGCNPSLSQDGQHSCGYTQVLPANRRRYCGLSGTDADCDKFKSDVTLDINCGAAFIKGYIGHEKECDPFNSAAVDPPTVSAVMAAKGSAGFIGACYNAGAAGARSGRCGTQNYCVRIQTYYNSCVK